VELDGLHEIALAEQAGDPGREAAFFCLDIEIDERAGLVRVHDPRLFRAGQHAFCKRLLAAASQQWQIRRAEVNLATATCWIEFGPGLGTSQALAGAFIEALREASGATGNTVKRTWWQRIKDTFRRKGDRRAIAIQGVRSRALSLRALRDDRAHVSLSLSLNEWLRRAPGFGPIVGEWARYGGLSVRSKGKLIGLSGVILVVAIVISPLAPLALAVIVLLGFMGIYGITRLPDLSPGQEARPWFRGTRSLALSAS
jgi:hypothetical protein